MRKTIQSLSLVIAVTIIGLAGCMRSNKTSTGDGDCLARMSEETGSYIREMKIPLKSTNAEYYANKDEQVYLLNSQEPVKLSSKQSEKNAVAVINHKEANGKSSFYLIEQEITPDKITFVLSKDSKELESLPINLVLPKASIPGPGGPGTGCESYCDNVEAGNAAQLQALQVEANQTCTTRGICLPMCDCFGGVPSVAPTIIAVNPTSWRCWKNIAIEYRAFHFWALRNPGPFLDQAFDTAIKKEAALYAY